MPIQVPAPVEQRMRRKFSRRAKVAGWALIAAYVVGICAYFYFFSGGAFIFFLWTGGFALGARYLRAARHLANPDGDALVDDQTLEILDRYEHRIRVEGEREIAHGSLSMSAPAGEGELSFAADGSGALSPPEKE